MLPLRRLGGTTAPRLGILDSHKMYYGTFCYFGSESRS